VVLILVFMVDGHQRIVKKLEKKRQIGCQKDVERASRWRQKRRGEKVKNERKRDGKKASKTREKGCQKSGKVCRERKPRRVVFVRAWKRFGPENAGERGNDKAVIVRCGTSKARSVG
jgi:hypothetical protein